MADNQQGDGAAGAESSVEFAIRRIYVKDLSFEGPASPDIFGEEWNPDIDLQLHTAARQVAEHDYEVALTVTVTVKVGETTAFLVEVVEAGVFTVIGLGEEQLGPMLGAYCPNVLFPYAREAVSDLSVRGGFPQLVLAPVNFDALYLRHQQEQATA